MPDNDINDQLRQRAHAEMIKEQVRQRNLSPAERANESLEKRFAMLESENQQLRADVKQLRTDLSGMRITGTGFSGQGPRGISYTPPSITAIAVCNEDGTITITINS